MTTHVKLDSTLATDDYDGPSVIPQGLRRNVLGSAEIRTPSSGHAFRRIDLAGIATTSYLPTCSTHPDLWYAIPLLLPRYPNVDTLKVLITGLTATATEGMKLKLVLEGVEGSEETFTSTSLDSVELEVDVPEGSGRWIRGAIALQSEIASSGTAVQIDAIVDRGSIAEVTGSLGATGKAHKFLEITSMTLGDTDTARTRFHVPRTGVASGAVSTHDLWLWPHGTPSVHQVHGSGSNKDSGTVYALGTLTIYGLSFRYEGLRGGLGVIPVGAVVGSRAARAQHMHALAAAQREIYRRGRWYRCHPETTKTGWHGAESDDGGTTGVITAFFNRRYNAAGVHVAALWFPRSMRASDSPAVALIDMTLEDLATTNTTDITTGSSAEQSAPMERLGGDGTLLAYNLSQNRTKWGAIDLCLLGEENQLTLIEQRLTWPDSGSVGNDHHLTVDWDGDDWIGAAAVFEDVVV